MKPGSLLMPVPLPERERASNECNRENRDGREGGVGEGTGTENIMSIMEQVGQHRTRFQLNYIFHNITLRSGAIFL